MSETYRINFKAVAVATFANWAISVAWYSVFGRTWARLVGVPPEWEFELDEVIIGICFNGLMALGVAVVLQATRSHGAGRGALWGLVLAALFVLPAHSGKWTWQDQPLLLAIDMGAHALSLVASGLIVGAWAARTARTSPRSSG